MKTIVAYVPVLHKGYYDFFKRHERDAYCIYLFNEELIAESDYLHKEIRALHPEQARKAIEGWGFCPNGRWDASIVQLIDVLGLKRLHAGTEVVMPDEDVCHAVADKYLVHCTVTFDSVFLRWDRKNTLINAEIQPDRSVAFAGYVAQFLNQASEASRRASNWWRQVGAVAAYGDEVLYVAWNQHVPSQHTPYVEGDPRNCFKRGLHIDLSTDEHAEATIIGKAARDGRSLHGADLYITTFPCPPCAKLIGRAGIRRLFFLEGYAVLDGERSLRHHRVELIHVKKNPSTR